MYSQGASSSKIKDAQVVVKVGKNDPVVEETRKAIPRRKARESRQPRADGGEFKNQNGKGGGNILGVRQRIRTNCSGGPLGKAGRRTRSGAGETSRGEDRYGKSKRQVVGAINEGVQLNCPGMCRVGKRTWGASHLSGCLYMSYGWGNTHFILCQVRH